MVAIEGEGVTTPAGPSGADSDSPYRLEWNTVARGSESRGSLGIMPVMFEERGVRFAYPNEWELEVEANDHQTNVTLSAPDGLAFALVKLDEERPEPAEMASDALAAMREEYPDLEVTPIQETIDGHPAVGFDAEFFSLDIVNSFEIRCFRTDRRTIFLFGQWSDVEGEDPADLFRTLRRSIEETDAFERPEAWDDADDGL